jgi:hypothetical protein
VSDFRCNLHQYSLPIAPAPADAKGLIRRKDNPRGLNAISRRVLRLPTGQQGCYKRIILHLEAFFFRRHLCPGGSVIEVGDLLRLE